MLSGLNILILGIIISIIFYELTDVSPGGIIVPGILVAYIGQPERIIYTLLISLITYLLVKLLSRFTLIYGKRRFALLIIISILLNLVFSYLLKLLSISIINVSIIGYTVSGLIANEFFRQGIKKTLPSLIIVTGILEVIILISTRL